MWNGAQPSKQPNEQLEPMNSILPVGSTYFELMSEHLGEAALDLFSECNMAIERSDVVAPQGPSLRELSCIASIGTPPLRSPTPCSGC